MKPNMSGIIHSIIRLCVACLGSAAVGIAIFCCSHMVPPTKIARNVSGVAKFNHRNLFPRGSREYTTGQE